VNTKQADLNKLGLLQLAKNQASAISYSHNVVAQIEVIRIEQRMTSICVIRLLALPDIPEGQFSSGLFDKS
jgi:hypothetical protein